jgi:diaminopimelate epimerase
MHFRKMHGLGNDFVILDARTGDLRLLPSLVRHLADRHFGVGCDTVVVLEHSDKADIFARYYNADGSESGACGNATRCVADIIMKETGKNSCVVEVIYGLLPCRRTGELEVEVDMGPPIGMKDLDLNHGGVKNPVSVDMGNPHCVFFVDKLGDIDVEHVGVYFEHHKAFPNRTNVEFVEIYSKDKVKLRTWERGSGLTLACGSGACATIVAAVHKGLTGRKVEIELDGGTLYMEWRESDGHVLMRGALAYVFEGNLL